MALRAFLEAKNDKKSPIFRLAALAIVIQNYLIVSLTEIALKGLLEAKKAKKMKKSARCARHNN